MKIIEAERSDAPLLARAIMEAIGLGHCEELTEDGHNVKEVRELFEQMAARDDTQYSYRNALVAVDDDGARMGAIISYDGARLEELRRPFLEAAKHLFGMDPENVQDETDSSEYYLDTLMVVPEHRRKGVGAALIEAASKRAAAAGKPAGLLVDPDNTNARRLYESIGFREVGPRPFFGIMMDHLQR